jgi:hypothetical protein
MKKIGTVAARQIRNVSAQRQAMEKLNCPLSEPTTNIILVPFVFSSKYGVQFCFLQRNYDSVQVGNRQRQEYKWHDMVENGSLSDICQRKTHVHWIAHQPIGARRHKSGGNFTRNPRRSRSAKNNPAPCSKSGTQGENNPTRGSQGFEIPEETAPVEYGLNASPGEIRQDEYPRNWNTQKNRRQWTKVNRVEHVVQSLRL